MNEDLKSQIQFIIGQIRNKGDVQNYCERVAVFPVGGHYDEFSGSQIEVFAVRRNGLGYLVSGSYDPEDPESEVFVTTWEPTKELVKA